MTTAAPEVVTLGETMILFLANTIGPLREAADFHRFVAGAETNVATGLCRLGHTAGWISRLSDDELGRTVAFRLRGEGIDISRAKIDAEAPTGLMVRERRELGPIDVIYYRRGSAASRMTPDDLDADYIAGARYLHLTGITPALSASCRETSFAAAKIARDAGVPVVLDPNLRFKLWSREDARATLRELATHADIILPGLEEAEFLTGETDPETAAHWFLEHAPTLSLVVMKLGAEGSMAVTRDGIVRVPATPLPRVIDPVGAGDAFAAGFYAGQLRGFAMAETLGLANRCGAWATTAPGDADVFPRWDEVATGGAMPDVRR
jgi:2-dehydro-3-deoxygluconokinase